jgi:predicted GNAT superfamily acetyltransferase
MSTLLDWLFATVSTLNTRLNLCKLLHFVTVIVEWWDNDSSNRKGTKCSSIS